MGAKIFDHDAMRSARRGGLKVREVARKFGCSPQTASKVCRGVYSAHNHQADAARCNIAKAIAKRRRGPQTDFLLGSNKRRQMKVPPWVAAAGLTDDYRDFRTAFDDHYAARICRGLVAEAHRP